MFEAVGARYDGPELEKEILELWRRENVFGRIMTEGAARPQFVFYEGPPTANGRPGIHHVLARTFKDLYPRYKTMRGFHCPRRAGWDTHGLPVEHEIEKELGIFDKKLIEQEVGIAKFTAMCRASVMRHVAEWEAMTERMGFWVDFKQAYFTLHNDYIETVWELLKDIWDKGSSIRASRSCRTTRGSARRCRRTKSRRVIARSRTRRSSCASRRSTSATRISSSGRPRRGRCRRTCCSRCIRTSSTRGSSAAPRR